ncbi:MAG: hypothetical protein ACYCZY_08985 [Lacisediminihabitans sp.]
MPFAKFTMACAAASLAALAALGVYFGYDRRVYRFLARILELHALRNRDAAGAAKRCHNEPIASPVVEVRSDDIHCLTHFP